MTHPGWIEYVSALESWAEDLVQETFLAVIRAASPYEPRALVRTYLYGIALKLLAAERRKFLTSSCGQSPKWPTILSHRG